MLQEVEKMTWREFRGQPSLDLDLGTVFEDRRNSVGLAEGARGGAGGGRGRRGRVGTSRIRAEAGRR